MKSTIIVRIAVLINVFAIAFTLSISNVEAKKLEKEYVKEWCDLRGGISSGKKLRMSDNSIADCILSDKIVEFDFDYKWHECHSQAKLYSKLSGKPALCVLINTTKPTNKNPLRFIERFNLINEDTCPKVKLEIVPK